MDWLTEFWEGFSKWWATIDWGDAPGWVGAFLTSGSLLLAVLVLRNELRASRMAEVRKVVPRYRVLTTFDSAQLEVTVHNANPHPIAIVMFLHWGGHIWHRKFFKNPAGLPELAPSEEGVLTLPWAFPDYPRDKTALVYLTDSSGNTWYRGLETGQIFPERTVKRWLRRGRWQRVKERFERWLSSRKRHKKVTSKGHDGLR